MIKLKPVTETSWIVLSESDQERIGVLTDVNGTFTLMAKKASTKFKNRKEVIDFFSQDVFSDTIVDTVITQKQYYIHNYPVSMQDPVEVVLDNSDLPVFSKSVNSSVYFAAGYYCLDFPKQWQPSYCPKLETLSKYNYKGPFKNEQEMKSVLLSLRRQKCKA